MVWQDYRDRSRSRRTGPTLGPVHLTPEGRFCVQGPCRCPTPSLRSRLWSRLGDRLSSRSHLGLLLLAAVVALALLLHG